MDKGADLRSPIDNSSNRWILHPNFHQIFSLVASRDGNIYHSINNGCALKHQTNTRVDNILTGSSSSTIAIYTNTSS